MPVHCVKRIGALVLGCVLPLTAHAESAPAPPAAGDAEAPSQPAPPQLPPPSSDSAPPEPPAALQPAAPPAPADSLPPAQTPVSPPAPTAPQPPAVPVHPTPPRSETPQPPPPAVDPDPMGSAWDEPPPTRRRWGRRGQRRPVYSGQALPAGKRPPPYYPYVPGTPLPEGYHIERRARRGLVLGGALTTGLTYFASVMVSASQEARGSSGWLLLPVVGPWVTLATRSTTCGEIGGPTNNSIDCFADEYGTGLLVADGALQALGVAMITLGVLTGRDYAVANTSQLRVLPAQFSGGGYGLSVSGNL